MIRFSSLQKMALSFADTEEQPHFHLVSFRWKKKIFATFWEKENRAMLKLPLTQQSVFCDYDPEVFFPVPGTWGKQGATFVDLKKVKSAVFKDALTIAYQNISKRNGIKTKVKNK